LISQRYNAEMITCHEIRVNITPNKQPKSF
jgi:hypothetical protein